jgi:hypothetical protein
MSAQVPAAPVQASQTAQVAVAQQRPSRQLTAHWLRWVQVAPFCSLQSRSWPAAQVAPQGVHEAGQKPSAVALQVRAVDEHSKVQAATLPVRVRMVAASLTQVSNWVWQADTGSHFSPASTTPLPQVGWQSLSLLAWQAGGQQPSPLAQVVCRLAFTHSALQAAAVPCSVRRWQPTGGQLAGQLGPSHFSLQAGSVVPLPQRQVQSLSLTVVQPEAQHMSPDMQAAMTVSFTHSALHWAALPVRRRVWQPIAGQLVGQLPSHFSPGSTTPLPQRTMQSLSLVLLQAAGQQPSPRAHMLWVPSSTQRALQVAAIPSSLRRPQPIQGQVAGQLDGGSQVSPVSTTPFPQRGMQSLSLPALHADGQQPSPFMHADCRTSFTHWA